MNDLIEFLIVLVSCIIGVRLGDFIYEKLFHKPIYRKRSIGLTVWIEGTKEGREEYRAKYLAEYGPED